MNDLNINDIQPRMRRTVTWLRDLGFETTDSGDGITNVEAGMEGAMEVPHVVMVVKSTRMVEEATRLHNACLQAGVNGKVEVTYDPADKVSVLFLFDVMDDSFPPV